MQRTVIIFVTAIASALGGAGTAAGGTPRPPLSAPGPGWSVTPSPNPVVPTGQAFWVSCPATNSCMAVGTYGKASGVGANLAEQWNGTSWRILRIPNPPGSVASALFGVSCSSLSACTAVGSSGTSSGASRALAERWNGTRWAIQATPAPAGGGGFLNAVSCTSPSACTAVGSSSSGTLAERWNGSSWAIQATPSAPGGFLSGVSCTSATACTAVGASSAGTLAERWNGTSWHIQVTPNPAQGGGFLNAVACTSSSACTATGLSNTGTLAEQWNGTSWHIQVTPNPAQGGGFLNAVACTSSSACTAAGAYINSSGTFQALAERWNGSTWSIQPAPSSAAVPTFLIGVACASATACTAVGYSAANGPTVNLSPAVVAELWNGTSWQTQRAPNPSGAASSWFGGVACTSPSACTAVGFTTSKSRTAVILAERWNGRAWRIQATPSPASGGALNGVACTSRSACTAVGTSNSGKTLAERWNDTRWRIQPTPSPAGGGTLNGVSCASPSACTAVGGTFAGKTLAERWNGRTWRIQPTPSPAGPASSFLTSVACTGRSACMAVGVRVDNDGAVGTLAERWNGRRWQIVPTFKPNGEDASLGGVACTSSSSCIAVGSSSLVTTLAERWNGTAWHVQATPNPPGGQNIFFNWVACPNSTTCTAVGLNITGSGPLPLAERWSGGKWRIQPMPGIPGAPDLGINGVACPNLSACTAVGNYVNHTGPSLPLVERWNRPATTAQPATGGSAAPGALPFACIRAQLLGSRRVSGRASASPWFWSHSGSSFSRTGAAWPGNPPCAGLRNAP